MQDRKQNQSFESRHIGPQAKDQKEMLQTIGVSSLDKLMDEIVPSGIRIKGFDETEIGPALSEYEYLQEIEKIGSLNKNYKSYIGLGYYNCITPPVILRNVFENPGWYTQYTPYQAEISQGRLEALFHFQTMIVELTGLDIANASLLDEATAAAEAMTLLYRHRRNESVHTFFVSQDCFPQTLTLLKTRGEPLGIKIEIGNEHDWQPNESYFGALIQYPNIKGELFDYSDWIQKAKQAGVMVAVGTDLLALTLLKSPASLGADVAIGSTQRFGVQMGYGGPSAAFFATRKEYQRSIPGRLVGKSIDRLGQESYRLTLQTREQHIRREKATSNICTAQALLAIMAVMYAIYHGPEGLKKIALKVHSLATLLAKNLEALGYKKVNQNFFDTITIDLGEVSISKYKEIALSKNINICYLSEIHPKKTGVGDSNYVSISLDETSEIKDIHLLCEIFAEAKHQKLKDKELLNSHNSHDTIDIATSLLRKDIILSQEVFHLHHSETSMMRYLHRLEAMDLALNQGMIPLGSCTMKLNPAVTMMPLSWSSFYSLHPFAPLEQTQGYQKIFTTLEANLAKITGMKAVSLQPNSGAQGEYTGLLVIRAYHRENKQEGRTIALIPTSAHGTNPSSAAMAGMDVVLVQCDSEGNVDLKDLKEKVKSHKEKLSCIMITYPSTHGIFEENIQSICDIVHEHGGLVYLDGANMNAQVGLCTPAKIGADVCHLNLHKTFSIPHGGGGPGMGPICVNEKLAPFLPTHPLVKVGGEKGIQAVSATPWGSASILLISYGYIRLLGPEGIKNATMNAILNANYIKKRLENYFSTLYTDKKGRVAHEMILDFRPFKKYGIEVEDVAKRLIDYGFHAPTMSWPVPGTLMVEPTESEPKSELDRFCNALISIRQEIQDIIDSKADPVDNVLKNSPHPPQEIASEDWIHSYSRKVAAYPIPNSEINIKFWPPRARIDNAYGDKNLVCSCPPVSDYERS